MNVFKKSLLTVILAISGVASVNAGVVIGGTRVIYEEGKKEASLSVNNADTVAYLIQSWIDMPNNDTTQKAPFIITPPLYRLDPQQQNIMRIVRTGSVPADKESMFWLNVKSIPSAETKPNTLQIAVKSRMKLIYRPDALKESSAEEQVNKLTWHKIGTDLQVSNPTAYYMNFNEISVGGKKLPSVSYVAPGQTNHFALPNGTSSNQIDFKLINDFGGIGAPHRATY